MARIDSKVLFLTTSPRTPEKMIPEIGLLVEHFAGQAWNRETQLAFMEVLREENFFNGEGANDPTFSARDRINRAPQSLGFATLGNHITLTPAGERLLSAKRKDEVFLRQMLKFQLPSPYHVPTPNAVHFCVKPYLELLRLVRTLGTLRFDELQLFGMQLTDWHKFNEIVSKVEQFRIAKTQNQGSYRNFKGEYLRREVLEIYSDEISRGATQTRESNDSSLDKFVKTKGNNMRDYADASFRYLRATGLVNVSHIGKSLSIVPERIADVDYILSTVDRTPVMFENATSYAEYLGNAETPTLFTDNRETLIERIATEFPTASFDSNAETDVLKDLLADLTEERKQSTITAQVKEIKDYKLYDDIQHTYEQIANNELYDAPLMLEWNTWRAMTMLDGGDIKANLNFDDYGHPLSTAAGNMADIVADYDDFQLTVEVTMASGQKQYDMEGEPVSRHLGKLKKQTDKPCYCLFVAPNINEACIAHFFILHRTNVAFYGGKSVIVPLPVYIFQKMLEDSYKASYTPNPKQVQSFFEYSKELANKCESEQEWYDGVCAKAMNWL